ncbi:uncharacterized protein LOC133711197 [Rosa rugosa]|uniref:uncharacterized protein LOC133711197 n=1 Tax=Rosa rugosa TaxID=74645 RepID=UPI002B4014F8|nr:uncharacterized protein LOC133711197 [Rosa rugosa]
MRIPYPIRPRGARILESNSADFDRSFENHLRSNMLKQIVTSFLKGFQQQDFADPSANILLYKNQLQDFDRCSIYNSCFPPNEIVEWFELQSNGPSITKLTILLPPDLYRDANWIGLAFCASFAALKNSSANFANNVDPGLPHHLTCHLEKDDGGSLESLHDYCTTNEEFQWMHLGGFMWLSYIPRTWFSDQLNDCGCLEASITALLDLYEEKQDHEADGTSRTLADNHDGETSNANGIRDRDFDCALTYNSCFSPSDIVEWFGHHSNGPSVKIPLPSNLYKENTNWVGLALCAYFSVLDPSNASLDHLDSEKLDHHLTCYLETDSCSTDFFHCYITKNKEFKWLHLGGFLWVSYIPRRLLSLDHQSNECINLEASIGSDRQGLGVLKCGLRLLYQHDVEEFKKTIMHCKTSLSEHYNGENKPDVWGETESSSTSSKCVIGGPHSGKLERPQIDKGKGVQGK